MSVKISNYSFEKARYYAFRSFSLKEKSTITISGIAGAILTGFLTGKKFIAFSALNFTACTLASVALPLITLIGLRVLMGYFAEKSYVQAKTAQNTEEAFKLYKYAADKGQREAPYNVGWMYKDNLGVTVDKNQAFKYFALAILRGSEKSEELKTECIKMLSAKHPEYKDMTIEIFDTSAGAFQTQWLVAQNKKSTVFLVSD